MINIMNVLDWFKVFLLVGIFFGFFVGYGKGFWVGIEVWGGIGLEVMGGGIW